MHEAKFTEQIVETIMNELKKDAKINPKRVKVHVGEVYHLEKDSVLFYYGLVTKGTKLEGIPLDLEEDPVQIECRHCGTVGRVEDHHLLMCTSCGSCDVKVLSGQDIYTEFISEPETYGVH